MQAGQALAPQVRRRARRRRLTARAARFVWFFFSAMLLGAYLACAAWSTNTRGALTGWFVPDGITLFHQATEDVRYSTAELLQSYEASGALAILNAWLVSNGLFAAAAFNALLIAFLFGSFAQNDSRWPWLLLLLTPYYIASFALPSKDIPVAVLFVLAVRSFVMGRVAWPLALSVATIFFRDGFGAMLLFTFGYVGLIERFHIDPRKAMVTLCMCMLFFWSVAESFLEGSFIYARALGVAEQGTFFDGSTANSPAGYVVRLFGNATNLAFRPVFADEGGHLNVLGTFYWLSGLTLIVSITCCARGSVSENATDRRLGLIGMSLLLLISVTPYVQPRYLLPVCLLLPMFSFTSLRLVLRWLLVAVIVSLLASVAYRAADNYPPAASPDEFDITRERI